MPDTTKTGFGSTIPIILSAATLDTIAITIASTPQGLSRIRKISIAAIELAGAASRSIYVPVFVVRGSSQLTAVPTKGEPIGGVPGVAIGMPQLADLSGLELMFTGYIDLDSQATPFEFTENELNCTNGQKLVVIVMSGIDVSTSPPTWTNDGVAIAVTVLGDNLQFDSNQSTFPIGPSQAGFARSLPRFDVQGS